MSFHYEKLSRTDWKHPKVTGAHLYLWMRIVLFCHLGPFN